MDDSFARRRRSIFKRSSLVNALTPIDSGDLSHKGSSASSKTLKKRRTPSSLSTLSTDLGDPSTLDHDGDSRTSSPKPTATPKGSHIRPGSIFGSWRSKTSVDEYGEPLTASSSKTPSVNWGDLGDTVLRSKNVLRHSEVQTSTSMFRKKKEYLVLTETHLVSLKSQQKAAEIFSR